MMKPIAWLFCLLAAACAAPSESTSTSTAPAAAATSANPRVSNTGKPLSSDTAACMSEVYAYVSVAALAQKMGSEADVFQDALDDLRQQLVDCLESPPPDLIPVNQRRSRTRTSY
jgi:predicted outer membrane protein